MTLTRVAGQANVILRLALLVWFVPDFNGHLSEYNSQDIGMMSLGLAFAWLFWFTARMEWQRGAWQDRSRALLFGLLGLMLLWFAHFLVQHPGWAVLA